MSKKIMTEKQIRYWIIGAGRFGTQAFHRLKKKSSSAQITIIDINPAALTCFRGLAQKTICNDGVDFLIQHLKSKKQPNWIVPAVPIHLAFEWIRLKMPAAGLHVTAVPERLKRDLPNPSRGGDGQLYVSYADFVCPDNCREPYDRCTFTGKPRKGFLYSVLKNITLNGACSVVIRSHQLAPGVGGYRPEDLERARTEVLQCKAPLVLLSTACACHGVIHALTRPQD